MNNLEQIGTFGTVQSFSILPNRMFENKKISYNVVLQILFYIEQIKMNKNVTEFSNYEMFQLI